MKSANFEFLRQETPDLADLGAFAERYLHTDRNSALIKLRTFAENIVSIIYGRNRLYRPDYSSFNDLLNDQSFIDSVPQVIVSKLHLLRINGNKAAHDAFRRPPEPDLVLSLIKEAFSLGQWFYLAYLHGKKENLLEFSPPEKDVEETKVSKKAQEQIAAQEAKLAQLISELEKARQAAKALEYTKAELESIRKKSQETADALKFSEAQTRKLLIDTEVRDAGWNISGDGSSTDEVGQEIPVKHQPTPTGNGAIDYVLYDDAGKILAVIEAKKTARSVSEGKTQAELYAEGVKKDKGYLLIIFYTNGYDIRIWNKEAGEPPRRIFGFYSKESLMSLRHQNENRLSLSEVSHKPEIIDRPYQIEAVRRVTERMTAGHRKSLIVLATGTGKTRVAIALCDLLGRAKWAKRILFLCDRRELRKQADKVYGEYMSGEPRTYVTRKTADDRTKRIYLATYPAMMKAYTNFDVGFFDLIIADESHRSIYNKYLEIFKYFDAHQVGLTATPVKFIARNTYRMFGCEDQDPTASFTYDEAIASQPPYLVPMKVTKHTTKFLRGGIKYSEMSEAQREELEDHVEDPEAVDYSREQVDKKVFNKDTDRKILRNLMENGIRNALGTLVGKTIIFARNHEHAILLNELFDDMYPQYGGRICKVIDNYEPRAEQLIDTFKDKNSELTIAISVDMLDTGIDVPEVVNLVFAKPVKSYVKFWQMIGRGTRLCPNLFGPGQHKEGFQIFDHWGNFEYFGEDFQEREPTVQKSLFQKLFEARIDAAEAALNNQDIGSFDIMIDLIYQDINALPNTSVTVKEKWKEVHALKNLEKLKSFDVSVRSSLRNDIAPLMSWRDANGNERAYAFDLLVSRAEATNLTSSAEFQNHKDACQAWVSSLPVSIDAVRAKIDLIEKVKSEDFWKDITTQELDEMRKELRPIVRFRRTETGPESSSVHLDVTDDGEHIAEHTSPIAGETDLVYKRKVRAVLDRIFDQSPALKKVKNCLPVTEEDLSELVGKVQATDPSLRIDEKLIKMPDTNGRLDVAIRHIIGLEPDVVEKFFADFMVENPSLTPHQIRFLGLLKSHIAQYGKIDLESLWEAPFTSVHEEGIDGVFEAEEQAQKLISLIEKINSYVPDEGRVS
jgi:type I restriction enzyme R subunit